MFFYHYYQKSFCEMIRGLQFEKNFYYEILFNPVMGKLILLCGIYLLANGLLMSHFADVWLQRYYLTAQGTTWSCALTLSTEQLLSDNETVIRKRFQFVTGSFSLSNFYQILFLNFCLFMKFCCINSVNFNNSGSGVIHIISTTLFFKTILISNKHCNTMIKRYTNIAHNPVLLPFKNQYLLWCQTYVE